MTDTINTDADAAAHKSDEYGAENGAERCAHSTTLRSLSGDELARRIERTVADDRKFFAQNPHRQYRVRRASAAEVEQFSRVKRVELSVLPPKFRWLIAVRRITPSVRSRVPFIARRLPANVNARATWELVASPKVKALAEQVRERGAP